jgi:hypothetical protein
MDAVERAPRVCPHCSQPLQPQRYGVTFGAKAIRIIDAIAQAGPAGVSGADLFAAAYGDNGARNGRTLDTLRSYIGKINRSLAASGIAIRSGGTAYRIVKGGRA